jgi:hypothetical protein
MQFGNRNLNTASICVFEPSELAPAERERLLLALESFVNLGDGLEDFLAFGKQNPEFFPFEILDEATRSLKPLAPPCVEGRANMTEALYWALAGKLGEARRIADTEADVAHGEVKIWTRVVSWEPACHRLVLFYRDLLRSACWPTVLNPSDAFTGDTFLILLGIDPPAGIGDWVEAFKEIQAAYPAAEAVAPQFSRLHAAWKTGTFEYTPDNDFQRAVYILFREGWRAKMCVRCSRRFIASKPVQSYCSTKCSGEAKRERNLAWWNSKGKKWRKRRETASRLEGRKSTKKGGK